MVYIANLEVWKKGVKTPIKGVKLLIERNFKIKTHTNLIYSCSTYLVGIYGLNWKFGGVKKRCEMAQKRCEMVDIEEFSNETSVDVYKIT